MTTPTVAAVANDLGEHCQLILGTLGYILASTPLGTPAMRIRPQKARNPEAVYISSSEHLTMRDEDYFSRVFMNNWQSGSGQVAYLVDDPVSKSRFYDSTGIDVSKPGQFSLVKAITANTDGTSANTTALPLNVAGDYLYMGDLSFIEYSAAWGGAPAQAATSASGNVTALENDGQYVYGAVAGRGINRWTIGSASAGTAWNADSTDYRRIEWANRVIYAINATSLFSFTGAGVRTTLFTPPTGWTPQDVCARRGGAIDSPILVLASAGNRSFIWYWDGITIHDYVPLPSGFVGMRLLTYLGLTFIYGYRLNPDATASPCAYYIQNDTLGFLGYMGLEQADGNPTADGSTSAAHYSMDAYDNFVYFGVSTDQQDGWRYDINNGGLSRYARVAAGTTNRITDLVVYKGGPWATLLGSGLYSTRATFVTTGTLTTSDMHLGQPWASNLWVNLENTFAPLLAGEEIALDYSTDQGTTWTSAGTASTLDGLTRVAYTLSNATTSVKNPYIRLRVTLTAGTSQLTTPFFYSMALKAAPSDPTGIVIEASLACSDNIVMPNGQPDWQGASGQERIYNVKNLYETQSVVAVIYLAPSATRAKNPVTIPMKIVEYAIDLGPGQVGANANKTIEGTVQVTLRQVQ